MAVALPLLCSFHILRRDMHKVLRRRQSCSPAILVLASHKVVAAVSMVEEEAALNPCECNSVFFLIISTEPVEVVFLEWLSFCHPQAIRHLHLFFGLSVLCH